MAILEVRLEVDPSFRLEGRVTGRTLGTSKQLVQYGILDRDGKVWVDLIEDIRNAPNINGAATEIRARLGTTDRMVDPGELFCNFAFLGQAFSGDLSHMPDAKAVWLTYQMACALLVSDDGV